MTDKDDARGPIVAFLPAKMDRLNTRVDGSLARLRVQREELAGAISRLSQGLLGISEEPLMQTSRDRTLRLIEELTRAKAELDELVDALELVDRDRR